MLLGGGGARKGRSGQDCCIEDENAEGRREGEEGEGHLA